MFLFFIACFFLIVAIFWLSIAPKKHRYTITKGDYRTEPTYGEVNLKSLWKIPFAIGLAFMILASFTVVGARNVGVEKFFSATTGRTMDAGFHLKLPWYNVTDIDARINPEEYDTSNPILVKIGDQGEAKVALAYRWRINPDGADDIYKDYGKFGGSDDINAAVRKALVSTNIKAALNEELGTYNPLQGVEINASMTPEEIAKVVIPPIPYAELNEAVQNNLQDKIADLGDLIDIQSVSISYLQLPDSTQKKINLFNTKIQDSKNALIDIAIKQAQATANQKLAQSVDRSPNVLVSKCLDSLADGDFNAPAGFSCWPGGGSGVVIPSSR